MSASALAAVEMLRSEHRQIARGPMLGRYWQAVRLEWQRRQDRAMALSLLALGHDELIADYRMSRQGR